MKFKKIKASKPTVVPATTAKTYDCWKLVSLQITDRNKFKFNANLRKGCINDDGEWEFSHNPSDQINLVVNDLEAESDENVVLQNAISSLLEAVEDLITKKSKV